MYFGTNVLNTTYDRVGIAMAVFGNPPMVYVSLRKIIHLCPTWSQRSHLFYIETDKNAQIAICRETSKRKAASENLVSFGFYAGEI